MEQSKASKQAAAPAKRPGIIRFYASMGQYIAGVCRDFMQGDLWVKLSALLWGSSCVARGQYVKGVLLTVLEALLAYFIPVVFWSSMSQLGTLGTVQQQRVYNPETRQNEFNDYDNSFLIMLFGVIGCVLLLTAVVLWLRNIRAARAVEVDALRFLRAPSVRVPTDSALPSAGELISDVRTYLERAGAPLSHDQAVEVLAALTLSPVTVLCGPAFAPKGELARALAGALGLKIPFSLGLLFGGVLVFAVARGFLRYGEQACNHFIAFKLLALLREKVFQALRRLCPAKLEGKDRGNLIALITSDIWLLEVFYAHTLSPIAIAALFTVALCLYIGSFHWALGLLALAAYAVVGVAVPLVTSRLSGDDGLRFRQRSGELSRFVLDSRRGLSETLQ